MDREAPQPQTKHGGTADMDGAISAIPKGFYLIVGGQLATRHDTLLEAQTQMHLFLQRAPRTVAMIAEIIPREVATDKAWVAL